MDYAVMTQAMASNRITKTDKSKQMMRQIQELDFAIVDLTLYLDTHCYDTRAISRLQELVAQSKDLRAEYVKLFGPIMARDVVNADKWVWAEQDFPWDYF